MKNLSIFIALFVIVCNHGFGLGCTYVTSDGDSYEYVSVFTDYFQVNEYRGYENNSYTFTLCPQEVTLASLQTSNYPVPCTPVNSSVVGVCEVDSDGYSFARGFASDVQISYSNDVMEMLYSYNDPILDRTVKTLITLGCSGTNIPSMSVSQPDETLTVISVNASFGCQQPVYLDGDMPSHLIIGASEVHFGIGFIFTVLFWLLVFIIIVKFTYCLYWCVTQRKRKAHCKNIQQQYSNVAFQPIPMNNPVPTHHQQPIMPVVYMPMMPNMQPQFKQDVVEMQQFKSDEQLAREMQAKYDAEV